MAIVYHVRKANGSPKHTLAFEYDTTRNKVYVGWAKPHHSDVFSKKRGFQSATTRLERIKEFDVGVKENLTFNGEVPHDVRRSIVDHMDRIRRYYKDMQTVTTPATVMIYQNVD